ncbi:hypothetical protein [Burkholderia contaminans]|uniref:hypothetical protein n=1 Tax=Burkholderia contaminans TaxID=488447 RepID=UPI00158DDD65|nr:hypothetical protein [Burkholderia contaminans]
MNKVYISGLTKRSNNFIEELKSKSVLLPDYEFLKNDNYVELVDLVKVHSFEVQLTKEEDEEGSFFRIIIKDKGKEFFQFIFVDFGFMFKKVSERIRAYASEQLAMKFDKFLAIKDSVGKRTKI